MKTITKNNHMQKIKPNKFKKGDKVKAEYANLHGHEFLTVSDTKHNGFTWMYSFEETDMRCGEQYLTLKSN